MKFILPKARDPRFVHLAEIAAANGYEVITYENELPAERGVFFLPLNLCEAELLAALESIPDQSAVFAGKSCEEAARLAKEKNAARHFRQVQQGDKRTFVYAPDGEAFQVVVSGEGASAIKRAERIAHHTRRIALQNVAFVLLAKGLVIIPNL